MSSSDPTVVRSIAVTGEDLVAALEARKRSGRDPVLRVTPPFSGRMRARLHMEGATEYDEPPAPIHISPADLVDAAAPAYPTPEATEDSLRSDPEATYSRDRHREHHAAAVDEWRETVTGHTVDSVTLPVPEGTHEVTVTLLG